MRILNEQSKISVYVITSHRKEHSASPPTDRSMNLPRPLTTKADTFDEMIEHVRQHIRDPSAYHVNICCIRRNSPNQTALR